MRSSSEHIQVVLGDRVSLDSLNEHPPTQSKAVSVLPRHHATVRVVELPSQNPAEIDQMAGLAAEEMVPFSSDEMVLTSTILSKSDGGKSKVLIAIAHLDVVEQHLEHLRSAGLDIRALYLSTSCLMASLLEKKPHSYSSVHIHLDAASLDLVVLREKELLYNRGVELNTSSPESILDAMESALRSYSREQGQLATELPLHITTSFEVDESFWAQCEARLSFSGLSFERQHSASSAPLLYQGAGLLDYLALPYAVDLLPTSIKDYRTQQAAQSGVIKQLALFVAMLVLIAGTFIQGVMQRNAYLSEIEQQAATLRPMAEEVMQKRAYLQRLQEQVTRPDTPYQHLGRIMAQTPAEGLTISRFSYTSKEGIVLQGRADSRERFDGLIDQLRMVGKTVYPQFAQAQSIYDRQRKENALDVWEYAISIDFPGKASDVEATQ